MTYAQHAATILWYIHQVVVNADYVATVHVKNINN